MKRGMQSKKAQFYIIAAIIIVAILVGIAAYTNYAGEKKRGTRIYDLGDELGIETGYVYDYGTFQGEDLDNLIDKWTDVYINYTKGQEIIENWIFVYGNMTEVTASAFMLISRGTIGIVAGGTQSEVKIETIGKVKKKVAVGEGEEEVEVTFQKFSYEFPLEKGENFFFVISSEEAATTS